MKKRVAIVRGKFLNAYEMQFFEPLVRDFALCAFGSLTSYHDRFAFPVVKLPSPMDLPDVPYKMPILNRLCIDAHYLWGLEEKLKGFDLVHTAETYFHYTQQCLEAKRNGYVKKVIATVLENIPFNNERIWGRKAFKARARRDLDHIIALTQKTREALLAEGADPKKITVIGHFIDTKRFTPAKRSTHAGIVILFSGRLESYKGVFDVIEAVAGILKNPKIGDRRTRLVMAGDGSEKKRLLQLERNLGIADMVSHVNVPYAAMPGLYREADIFVAPSKPTKTWEEQYCTALLEAQAAGLAIVTTRTGGIPENIGDAGILVAPGDVGALRGALMQFILDADWRKVFGAKARMHAVTVHDSTLGAKKLKELYLRVMEEER